MWRWGTCTGRRLPGGREHVRYAGSPLALSFSEADDVKEVRLLDFESGALASASGRCRHPAVPAA